MLVLGSAVFLLVIFIPMMVFFISIGKLWMMFLYVVVTLVIVQVYDQVEYLYDIVDYCRLL